MKVEGERVKRTRLVQIARYVVAVEVEAVIHVCSCSAKCANTRTAGTRIG